MSNKKHKFNEKKERPDRELVAGEPVPGTGHETKLLKQKGK